MPEIGEKIRQKREEIGMSRRELSALVDLPEAKIQALEIGKQRVDHASLAIIAKKMDLDANWLLGLTDVMPASGLENECENHFIQIKRHPIEVSAGNGADGDVEADTGTGHYAYNKKWLERRGLKPNSLSVISVRGDSMEPEIYDKDLVLLDHTDTHLKEGPIYVVRYSNDVFVKRIQKLPRDQLQLVSKNTDYLPIVISSPEADGVEIIGRVVSSMHEW